MFKGFPARSVSDTTIREWAGGPGMEKGPTLNKAPIRNSHAVQTGPGRLQGYRFLPDELCLPNPCWPAAPSSEQQLQAFPGPLWVLSPDLLAGWVKASGLQVNEGESHLPACHHVPSLTGAQAHVRASRRLPSRSLIFTCLRFRF